MQWNITDYQEVAGQTGYATVCCSVGQIVRLWHATKAFSLSVIWSELNFPAMMPYMRSLDHFQNRPWHKSSLLVWEKLLIWTPKSPQVGKEDDNLIWSRSKSLEILYLYETCLNMYVVCLGGCWWVHMICTYDIYEHMCEHVYMCKCVYTRIMDNGRFQKLWKPCNLARPAVEVNIALFLVPACCVLFPLGRGLNTSCLGLCTVLVIPVHFILNISLSEKSSMASHVVSFVGFQTPTLRIEGWDTNADVSVSILHNQNVVVDSGNTVRHPKRFFSWNK